MKPFDLARVVETLEGLEETIISKLIDRAQFKLNPSIYEPGASGFDGESTRSLFEIRLSYQERMDAAFGRFCVPEERPFTKRLPAAKRKVVLPPTGLVIDDFNSISLTNDIRSAYLELVPRICMPGSDGHFGSSVEHDVYALQAIARRIHYGALYVAESKYRQDPTAYDALIKAKNTGKILELLTRRQVEEAIAARIRSKVDKAQAGVNPELRHRIDPGVLEDFYREHIIALTKQGEVLYLLQRRQSSKAEVNV